MTATLEFRGISKHYGKLLALDQLSMALEPGEILGFVGPNGAGKTTAIHIALGFLQATSGSGEMMGHRFGDPAGRVRVGFVPDAPTVFAGSATSAVTLAGRLNNVSDTVLRGRAKALLDTFRLPASGRDARQFSRGMQQRLGLAQALVNDPELLILDEPTSALDPPGVLQVRELLRTLRDSGKAVFFSSHQLSEVEQVADRVAFLHEGRLLRCGNLESLMSDGERSAVTLRAADAAGEAMLPFSAYLDGGRTSGDVSRWLVPSTMVRRVLEAAWIAGGEVVSVQPLRLTLEELFIEWTEETAGVR